MRIKKSTYFTVLLLILTLQLYAQDIHFSQFYETPLYRNPALAGIFNGDVRVTAVYRNQWNNISNHPFKTISLSGEYKLPVGKQDDYLTIAAQIYNDKAGAISYSNTMIYPGINYSKSLNSRRNMYLSVGFMGGINQRSIDRNKITTNSQYDGTGFNAGLSNGEPNLASNVTFIDGAAGLSFNMSLDNEGKNNLYFGVAYHHFNKPKTSFYNNPTIIRERKFVISGGLRMNISDNSFVTFHGDFLKQGASQEIIGGGTVSYKLGDYENPSYIISAGANVRWKDALIPIIRLDYRPFSVGVSYDINVSQLKTATQGRGGFEITLSYIGFLDRNNSTKNAVLCPRF